MKHVEKRVGQVWGSRAGYVRTVRGFTSSDEVIMENNQCGSVSTVERSDTYYFCLLISDPLWGNMKGWAFVTDEQKKLYRKPHCAEFILGKYWTLVDNLGKWHEEIYRVPSDFTDWEPIKPARPKYKTFPMKWNDRGPWIDGADFRQRATTNPRIYNYRIGWFCDHEHEGNGMPSMCPSTSPMTPTGRRYSYALGILEES